jgi:uncharacterized SAM-binding protein YcdF (DUF218 family)
MRLLEILLGFLFWIILGILLRVLFEILFGILFGILLVFLLGFLLRILQRRNMNLTNLVGPLGWDPVLDSFFLSLRESLWSGITVRVWDSTFHGVWLNVGGSVYRHDSVNDDDEDDDFDFDDWEDTP